MKVIIAGGRDITDYELVLEAIRESGFTPTKIVSGGARGVDALGERYARDHDLPYEIHQANWVDNGRAAGPIRNRLMASVSEGLIAIWDGKSRGTKNMIDEATKRNLKVFVKLL